MKTNLSEYLKNNSYPGRGILIGKSANGQYASFAYFIMGRSENSRNRLFVEDGEGIRIVGFDPDKLIDPSLILYRPVRVLGNKTIITNGDQTDTIYDALDRQQTFEEALRTRTFEPDAPHYTPRISAILRQTDMDFNYALSIIKTADGDPSSCRRFTFSYTPSVAGSGHLIHTYAGDGDPLPSFSGEPVEVAIPDTIEELTDILWGSLDEENKVSLFVRTIHLIDGSIESRIINKNA